MRVVVRILSATALLLAMLLVLGGPTAAQDEVEDPLPASTAAELEEERSKLVAAQAAWEERPWDSYYTLYRYCLNNAECISDQFCLLALGCTGMEMGFTGQQLNWRADVNGATPTIHTYRVEALHAQIAEALASDPYGVRVSYTELGVPTDMVLDRSPELGDEILYRMRSTDFEFVPNGWQVNNRRVTVTCLGGAGRIDVNMMNVDSTAATYRLQVGDLSPRQRTVEAQSIWRTPITGRRDGELHVSVTRNGERFIDETVTVACDEAPEVHADEVEILSWCIGGNGIIFAQFANPTDTPQAYILEVAGVRRSTTAAAYGASVRGISGRADGVYEVTIELIGRGVGTRWVDVRC